MKEETTNNNVPTDDEVRRSDLYAQISAKLATNERKILEMEQALQSTRDKCATALADAELARTTLEELQQKHAKRWAELTDEQYDEGDGESSSQPKSQADQIVTLQHKLTQALENVRQAEMTRKALSEATAMNDSLQAKLEEIKGKYAALQASRSSSSSGNNHVSSSSGVTTPKQKPSSASAATPSSSQSSDKNEKPERAHKDQSTDKLEKSERLYREYKKLKKEFTAITASREALKAKWERTEKERDSLMQTNSRLLKQTAEKDDMNAKSLSTILHLKQVTEKITEEKASLEQQVKSAQQLALAARLAANARERVSEEFVKERKELEKQIEEMEQNYAYLSRERETLEGKLSQQQAKMEALVKDVTKAKARCEELTTESTKLQEEKQKMMESLAIAQRDAADAAQASESFARKASGSGAQTEFTAEQLSTQVSVLKGRLACPVCNHRDKKCILLRCRHMFCKQCVDENIKNRSRKCPACGGRFDTKDVADVWL